MMWDKLHWVAHSRPSPSVVGTSAVADASGLVPGFQADGCHGNRTSNHCPNFAFTIIDTFILSVLSVCLVCVCVCVCASEKVSDKSHRLCYFPCNL